MSEQQLPQVRRRKFTAFDAGTISRLPTAEHGQWWGCLETPGYVYGVEFDNGDVKVGRSSNPRKRLRKHQDDARRWLSAEVTQGWITPEHANHVANERTLLDHCAALGGELVRGVEVFRRVEFDAITSKAKRLAFLAPLQGPAQDKLGFIAAGLAAAKRIDARQTPEQSPDPLPDPGIVERCAEPEQLQQSLLGIARASGIPVSEVMHWGWFELQAENARLFARKQQDDLMERIESEGRYDLLGEMLPEELRLPDEPEPRDPSPQVLLPEDLAERVATFDPAERESILEVARWMAAWELRRVAGSWCDVSAPTRAALNRRAGDLEQTKTLRILAQPPYDPNSEDESELTDEQAADIATALGWGPREDGETT